MSCKIAGNKKNMEGVLEEWEESVKKDELLEMAKGEYMTVKAPESGLAEMQKRIEQAKADKRKYKRQRIISYTGVVVVAALLLGIVLRICFKRKSGVHSFFTR